MESIADKFKLGMRSLAGGVTAVTTSHEGKNYGLTATAVCSVSMNPPRLLACVNCNGETYAAIQQSRKICVNFLSTEHQELAKRFAGMSELDGKDRFVESDWTYGVTGAPVLKGAVASFDCIVPAIIDTGSHGIVLGDIQSIENNPTSTPLLYFDAKFVTVKTF